MNATALINRLRERGIRIAAKGGELELDAPAGALDEALRADIVAHKADLLRILSWSRRSSRATGVELEPADRAGTLPLSWAQQRLWFLDQLEPGNAAYNISWTVRLRGRLDRTALQDAFTALTARHEALRTVFPDRNGEPEQRVLDRQALTLRHEDMRGVPDEQLRARLNALAGYAFDLARGPLLMPVLLQLADAEHVLLVVVHHIVADGASMRILFRELAAFYEARLDGREPDLPPLPVQYADYAVWQRRWLDSGEIARQGDYWRRQLAGLPPLLELPADRPRGAAMRYRGASVLRVLPPELAAELRRVSREHGCTLFMTMLAAFYVLLMRYSGREDLVVGTPLGGRSRTSLEGLIGFFINTVVLRTDLSGDPAFAELLGRVRETSLDAHANQDLPFEKLVEMLQPERELSYSPVFQVMFDLQEEPRWKLPVRQLEVIPEVVFSSRTASFDLTLSVRQAEQGLDAMFEYDTDLFDETTIEVLAERYQWLLQAIVSDPQQRLSDLPLTDPDRRQREIHDWNTSRAPYPAAATLADLFSQRVAAAPDAEALVAGGATYSYAELNRAASRVANDLHAAGMLPDQPVGLLSRRSAECVAAMLGILKAGGCIVPLDPAYPRHRLQQMLNDCRASQLLHAREDESFAVALIDENPVKDTVTPLPLDAAVLFAPGVAAEPVVSSGARNLAWIMYTSGTSGQPKGVELEHRGLVNYLTQLALRTEVHSADRILQFASQSFDIAIEECFTALLSGATLVLRDSTMTASLQDFVAGCERHAISWLSLPTAWWHELCEGLRRGDIQVPAALRVVVIGGEKADIQAFRHWQRHAGNTRLFNTYGPTEASIAAAWVELTRFDAGRAAELPLGYPVPNARVWVMDARLQPVPEGLPGEICIGGPGVARGYRGMPELTAECFVTVHLPDGATTRLYRTGDHGRYRHGEGLLFLGRVDGQVKLRGHRVEPGEVEAALAALPGAGRCAVVLQGEGSAARLVAYVTGDTDAGALREQLRQALPDYMVPAVVMALPELPFTANGKLDRAALPLPAGGSDEHADVAATGTEQQLLQLWQEVLGVPVEHVDADFFALGGHSLVATRLMARVRDEFAVAVPLRALFDHPTVRGLARALEVAPATGSGRITAVARRPGELLPVSAAQRRLWMLEQLEPGNPAYNLYTVTRIGGPLDMAALRFALQRVVERHEILRTVFAEHRGTPVQLVQPSIPVTLAEEVLTGATAASPEARLVSRIDAPFDLRRGPLFRAELFRLPDADGTEQRLLLLTMHHIVADGWSVTQLYRELRAHYSAYPDGIGALAELPAQYADYALWQQQAEQSGAFDSARRYWAEQLRDMPPLLSLPADFARPALQSYRGRWVSRRLSAAGRQRLEQFATGVRSSVFMVMLTAFKALLFRHTGGEDLVVGTVVAGRTRTELEPLVGCFLNTLVLRTRVGGNPDFSGLLREVRRTTLGAFEHQQLPFEALLQLLQPPRSAAYAPVVQVLFNLHNERGEGLQLAGLDCEAMLLDRAAAKFDLSVSVVDAADGLRIGFEYNCDLFADATMHAMVDDYLCLLDAMLDDPAQQVAAVALRPAPATHAYAPAFDASCYDNVATRFREVAQRFPARPAVVSGATTVSYSQLDAHASAVAVSLRAAGIVPGDRLALLLNHDVCLPAALLGCLRAGVVYVPLEPDAPPARWQRVLQAAEAVAVLADEANAAQARVLAPVVLTLPQPQAVCGEGEAGSTESVPAAALRPDAPAYILFTSGTTGEPKGVVQSQRNLLRHAATYAGSVAMTEVDRVSLFPSYGFDAAVMDIYGALLTGACLYPVDMAAADAEVVGGERLATTTVVHLTPTLWRFLAARLAPGQQLANVRALVLGGEEATAGDFELFRRHCPPGAVFINGLGPSECTMGLQYFAAHDSRLPGLQVPVGLPVPGVQAELRNAAGEPAGVVGNLVLESESLSPGYANDPDATAAVFSGAGSARRYRSGDRLRRLPDGRYVYAGRSDRQLKVRGRRFEPEAVESVLLAVTGVAECAVLVDAEVICACYSGAAEQGALQAAVAAQLPRWMVPARWLHVAAWPRLGNGKTDRRQLLSELASQSRDDSRMPPATAVGKRLATIWAALLPVAAPGGTDDFFALGGHSLLATRMLARVRDEFGVGLTLRELFAAPTLDELARVLEAAAPAMTAGADKPRRRPADQSLVPLSWSQRRLWFLDRLEPGSPAYNLHWAAELNASPDVATLQLALNDLVARHESLRTAFVADDGRPLQRVLPDVAVELRTENMLAAAPAAVQQRLRERVKQPFDLAAPPLLRATVLHTAEDAAVLLLTLHHIVSDGWSMGVLFRDLSELYAARLLGRTADLPALPLQYPDYALWQQETLRGPTLAELEAFWKQYLDTAPPLLELPLDRPRPPVQRHRGAWVNRQIPPAVLIAATQLAERSSATLFMVLLAVAKVLFMRCSGQTDLVIGAPVSGRGNAALDDLVGYFLNTLVFRTRLDPDAGFDAALAAVRESALAAYEHETLPFEKLLELLQPERSAAHSPLIQVTLNLHNEPGRSLRLAAIDARPLHVDRGVSKYDLSFAFVESAAGLQAGIEYNTDIFDTATAECLLADFETLLTRFTTEPSLGLCAPTLTAGVPAGQPHRAVNTPVVPDQRSLSALFADVVRQYPERPAVCTGDEWLSYAQLDARSTRLAQRIAARGVAGDRVALLMGQGADAIVAVLGALQAGRVYVPLDPESPLPRLQQLLQATGATTLVTTTEQAALLNAAEGLPPIVVLDEVNGQAEAPAGAELPGPSRPGDEPAYILFTSGSTGVPKGVVQTHRNVQYHARSYAASLGIGPHDRLSLLPAFGFDAAVMDIFGALLHGAALVPLDVRAERYPGELLDRMAATRVTVLHATPTVFRYLMRSKVCRHELDTIRAVVLGGEEASAADFELFRRQFRRPALFVNGLGPSESTTAAQFVADHDTRLSGGLVPVGTALPGTELLLVDEAGRHTGLQGELVIRSPYVARGYWQLAELTAERFMTDGQGGQLYYTGDIVRRLPDGQLVFVGRRDQQIKLRGMRIEPAEIEAALTACTGVISAAVLADTDEFSGVTRLIAYVTGGVEITELRRQLKTVLPGFMIPAVIMPLDELPLTANGKLDRHALPVPERGSDDERRFVAPRSATEQELSRIWADVLGLQRVGIHDDFFELGGHSLLAAQLAARMNESLRVVVPLRRLFDAPTVAEIAEHIDTLQWAMQQAED